MRDPDLQLPSPARRPFTEHYILRGKDLSSEDGTRDIMFG